jgi:thiol-disulfide isomerase/thioredoxin
MSPEELIAYVDNNDFLKEDATIAEAKKGWLVQMETSEGKMFKDFEAEYEGKVTKLSDYVGKGKYVLVDFWASWCGPCKAEIPNLIKVYNQYKGDKFEVLGVATWDKPEDTKRAIEQLNIPYPQIMNAQKAGSDAYGINGIPQIILFGPDGKILKRNLRGEAVEKAVAEALK